MVEVFGGAAVGLLLGMIGRYAIGIDWNPYAGMAWGIFAASIFLATRLGRASRARRGGNSDSASTS